MVKLSIKSKLQIMLVTASLGSMSVVGSLSWSKARDIITERIFEQLTSVRSSKSYQIESYLNLLRNQVENMCENLMVVEAMKEFDTQYDALGQTSLPPLATKQIQDYYEGEFIPRLAKNIDGTPVYETYRPVSPQAVYLQYQYIANNPNPVGEKDNLTQAQDGSGYSQVHQRYHELFRNLIKRFNYYDLFLIDPETGEIVYSVYKETDYATSLYTEAYRNSNLAEIVRQVRDNPDRGAIQLIDFKFYRPSYNAPAAFMAGPIYDGDKRVGVLAIQLPADEIDKVLTEDRSWKENGLGDTGETYLVGEDLRLRSVSRQFLEAPTDYAKNLTEHGVRQATVALIEQTGTPTLLQPIKTDAAKQALEGKVGTQIIEGYLGEEVLSSYAPLDIDGVDWGIITEMSLAEAYEPIESLENYLLLSVIVLILLMTLFAAIASRSLTLPIDRMVNRLGDLESDVGDLELDSKDELSELAEALNNIKKATRALNQEIFTKDCEQEKLLANIIPNSVVGRWQKGETIVDRAEVTIIAIRVEGLAATDAVETAQAFNELIVNLDNQAERLEVEKSNCFAETYIATCGLTKPRLDRIKRGVDFAMDALNLVKEIDRKYNLDLNLRIGIDTGVVTAALIGEQKFRYDLWGEPVSVATQLAQNTPANTIRVTQAVNDSVKNVLTLQPDDSVTLLNGTKIATWTLAGGRLKNSKIGQEIPKLNAVKDNLHKGDS